MSIVQTDFITTYELMRHVGLETVYVMDSRAQDEQLIPAEVPDQIAQIEEQENRPVCCVKLNKWLRNCYAKNPKLITNLVFGFFMLFPAPFIVMSVVHIYHCSEYLYIYVLLIIWNVSIIIQFCIYLVLNSKLLIGSTFILMEIFSALFALQLVIILVEFILVFIAISGSSKADCNHRLFLQQLIFTAHYWFILTRCYAYFFFIYSYGSYMLAAQFCILLEVCYGYLYFLYLYCCSICATLCDGTDENGTENFYLVSFNGAQPVAAPYAQPVPEPLLSVQSDPKETNENAI